MRWIAIAWEVFGFLWFLMWCFMALRGADGVHLTSAFAAMLACQCKATLADRKDR